MINNTAFKDANEAVFNYATAAARKSIDLQTSLATEWVSLNKKLIDLSPAKELVNLFVSMAHVKK
jgi:hypothetical protein